MEEVRRDMFTIWAQNNIEGLLKAAKKARQDLTGTNGADWQLAQLTLKEAICEVENNWVKLEGVPISPERERP